jgi:hypothetical protein
MDVFIVNDCVSWLRNARKESYIRVKSRIEEQCSFCAEKLLQTLFKVCMGLAIDEEARATGSENIGGF